MAVERMRRPWPGPRSAVALLLVTFGIVAYGQLGLRVGDLVPNSGGRQIAVDFFSHALSPALTSQDPGIPADAPPLLPRAAAAALRTVVYAGAAMALALLLGVVLGFAASTAWWVGDPAGDRSRWQAILRRAIAPALYSVTRVAITGMRSVHELLWAVLLLAALGLTEATAVLAIAIPYAGVLAKIFSELIDEAPRDAAVALRGAGASSVQIYVFGLLPRALPDITAYAFYRYECALRSSAILGFFGFETLGLYIRQSFNAGYYGEVWTYLYALVALILVFDAWSAAVRRRMVEGVNGAVAPAARDRDGLFAARPRSRFVRTSIWAFAALLLAPWFLGAVRWGDAFSARRLENLARFLGEIRPFPLRDQPWDWNVALSWASARLADNGWAAAVATLCISVIAILIAAAAGWLLALPAARNLASAEPFASAGRAPPASSKWAWSALTTSVRLLLVAMRAVPEYLWAFLAVAMLGPTAWPAIIALACHNAGILGRLQAETIENVDPATPAQLRSTGAGRLQIAFTTLLPSTISRYLLYVFYRWETCVREATVLGMLGIVSLGYLIDDARDRQHQDDMLLLILLGAAIVFAGDLLSALARSAVRRA